MSIKINLIPENMKMEQQRRKRFYRWMLVITLVSLLAGGWSLSRFYAWKHILRNRDTLQRKNLEIQQEIQTLNQAKTQLDQWENRIAVMARLGQYPEYANMFKWLMENCPELAVIDEITVGSPSDEEFTDSQQVPVFPGSLPTGTGGLATPTGSAMFLTKKPEPPAFHIKDDLRVMVLKGRTVNLAVIADLLNALKSSGYFSQTYMKHSWLITNKTQKVNEFEIECILGTGLDLDQDSGVDYAHQRQTENL